MPEEEIPRRMRRFYRAKEEEEEDIKPSKKEAGIGEQLYGQIGEKEVYKKEEAIKLAVGEVRRFREKHKRYPKREELDQIAESLFDQLKEKKQKERASARNSKVEKRRRKKGEGKEPKQSSFFEEKELKEPLLSESEIEKLSVADLFGEETDKKGEKKLTMEEELKLEGLEEFEETKNCSNCGKETEQQIFCPKCGTGFCKNCTKKTEQFGKQTQYTCPKCGKTVKK